MAWSVHARRSARVAAGLDAAFRLHRGPGFLHGTSLDGAPLPIDLDGRPRAAWGRLLLTILVTAAWGLRLYAAPWGLLTLCVAVISVVAGWVLTLVGWTGLPRRVGLSGVLHDTAAAVASADVPDVLRAAERIVALVFGEKTWSWRAVLGGAAPTLMVVGFVCAASGAYVERIGGPWAVGALVGLTQMWTVVLGNVLLDLLALQTTRLLLPWILRSPSALRIALGLLVDLGVLVVCTLGSAVSNTASVETYGSAMDWISQVFAWLWLGLQGGLSLSGIVNAPAAALIVGTGLGVLTGSFASLVHLGLLGLAGLNRLGFGVPARVIAHVTRRWADTAAGPALPAWAIGSCLLVGLSVAIGAESTQVPVPTWKVIDLPTECRDGCTIGSPVDEAGRFDDEGLRTVRFTRPIEVMDREVTQALWAETLAKKTANPVALVLAGQLRTVRAVMDGSPALPMEAVSWCDAARFANLLSLLDARTPAHSIGGDPTLPGCEEGSGDEGRTSLDADGYRLPTEAEWEVLARAGDIGAGSAKAWTQETSGWHTHAAAELPTNAWGLYDMHGNVFEWTADLYVTNPPSGVDLLAESGGARRVVRGGSFVNSARFARSAFRLRWRPQVRDLFLGFRLVRPPRPPP